MAENVFWRSYRHHHLLRHPIRHRHRHHKSVVKIHHLDNHQKIRLCSLNSIGFLPRLEFDVEFRQSMIDPKIER